MGSEIGVAVIKVGGSGTQKSVWDNLWFMNLDTAILIGLTDDEANNDTIAFGSIAMNRITSYGVRVRGNQANMFSFDNVHIARCDVGFYFEKGAGLSVNQCLIMNLNTLLQTGEVWSQFNEQANYHFGSLIGDWSADEGWKRTCLLRMLNAKPVGATFDSVRMSPASGTFNAVHEPMLELSGGANVIVRSGNVPVVDTFRFLVTDGTADGFAHVLLDGCRLVGTDPVGGTFDDSEAFITSYMIDDDQPPEIRYSITIRDCIFRDDDDDSKWKKCTNRTITGGP